jgi:hypothetical protein
MTNHDVIAELVGPMGRTLPRHRGLSVDHADDARIGTFDDFAEACAARAAAEREYGFHENHGQPKVRS